MTAPIALSPVTLTGDLRRDSPRPPALRNAQYEAQFDAETLFYDVYRAGKYVVCQGPPLRNLFAPLRASAPFDAGFTRWLGRARHASRDKRGEIWLKSDATALTIDGPVGRFEVPVQPDGAGLFAGHRVLTTLSKDNAPRWIADWIAYYRADHGADAVLLYDNGSTLYSAAELEAELARQFPAMTIRVIAWPFKYGPQGGLAGAVAGQEAPWDSDFCQTGSLQHARHRFLRHARSVLNVDIDEIVLPVDGRSIFAATETSRSGFVKFAGQWISNATPGNPDFATCRHADFRWRDRAETRQCPPKWCVVPSRHPPFTTSWTVHNLFGARANRVVDAGFAYRHMMAISNNWKEARWDSAGFSEARFTEDAALAAAFARTGLAQSTGSDHAGGCS